MLTCGSRPQLLVKMDINFMQMTTCILRGSSLSITRVVSLNTLCGFVKWSNIIFHLILGVCRVMLVGSSPAIPSLNFSLIKQYDDNCYVCTHQSKMVSQNRNTATLVVSTVIYYIKLTSHSTFGAMPIKVHVIFTLNHIPMATTSGVSPYELLY